MLARDGDVTGNRIGPARSSCAIHVGSYNSNRDSIYVQQQTISADGLSGIAFSTNVPHTVRGGPPTVPFMAGDKDNGRPCIPTPTSRAAAKPRAAPIAICRRTTTTTPSWPSCSCRAPATSTSWAAIAGWPPRSTACTRVVVTEQDEPQAVIGSTLHELAFPDFFQKHVQQRPQAASTPTSTPAGTSATSCCIRSARPDILQVQPRGEYLYAACGGDGLRVFDIAFIDNKVVLRADHHGPGVAARASSSIVQDEVRRRRRRAVHDGARSDPQATAGEQGARRCTAVYGYIYVADKYEGLILVGAGTTIDGNPTNNFLKREVTFNPDGMLERAPAASPSSATMPTSAATRAWSWCRLDDPQAAGRDGIGRAVPQADGGAGAVPLCLRLR